MDNLIDSIETSKKIITKLIRQTRASLKEAPEGTLKISKKINSIEYLQRTDGCTKARYIQKKNLDLAKKLAQKDYDLKVLKNLTARVIALDEFDVLYPRENLENIYESLSPERRELVTPIIPTNHQYIEHWENESFSGRDFDDEDESCYYTEKVERVRSKSEVIIANFLYHSNIPYKYECPLNVSGITIYPDFTILDVKRRRILYLEHFGMMDNPNYSERFVEKISLYQSAGIFPGKRLIMTFETGKKPLDTRTLRQIAAEYLY